MTKIFSLICNSEFTRQELELIITNYERDLVDNAVSSYIKMELSRKKDAYSRRQTLKNTYFNTILSEIEDHLEGVREKFINKNKK
jgi:hypothetical protein